MKKVQTIRIEDTTDLNKRVEELKQQEAEELKVLNKEFSEVDYTCKELERTNREYGVVVANLKH